MRIIINKNRKKIRVIRPGEYYVSDKDELISTFLESCVVVCLYDSERHIAGMNHFMLRGRIYENDILKDGSSESGISAMNELLFGIQKIGAVRHCLKAKVYGGGTITQTDSDILTIPHDNIRLARILIGLEGIPVVEVDAGDIYTRNLYMDVKSGAVFLRKTIRSEARKKRKKRDRDMYGRIKNNEQNQSIGNR